MTDDGEGDQAVAPGAPRLSGRRALVELVGVTGLAIAQPVLDVFGRAPDYFVLRGAGPLQIVVFAVLVVALPALVLWSVELVVRALAPRLHRPVHLAMLWALATMGVAQLARERDGRAPWIIGAIAATLLLVAYRRFAAVRLWTAYLAAAPVGFALLFLFTSPTSHLLATDPPVKDVEVGAPAPVVVIVLDELPLSSLMGGDGQIDRELYPNLASLADDAHWFRNATSVSPSTYHAVPAILTGRLTDDGEGPGAGDHPENLFTLLGGSYDIHAEETITRLCPDQACGRPPWSTILGDLGDDVTDAMGERLGMGGRRDPIAALTASTDPVGSFEDFVSEMSPDPRTVHVLHSMLPHRPYHLLPDGRSYVDPDPDIGLHPVFQVRVEDQWPATLAHQRLVVQTQLADRLLGEAFDRLRALDLYDDSVIVVTADHGISFDPGKIARPIFGEPLRRTSTTDLLWVPLLIKEPGQTEGVVSDVNALTVDIVPTIADILDVEVPWALDGRSLLGPARESTDKPWRPTLVSSNGATVGKEITIDGAAGLRDLFDRTLENLLPPAGVPDRVWRVGPGSDLMGRRVADLGAALAAADADLLDDGGDEGSAEVHALVRADVPDLAVGAPVAVAVDGIVAATGFVYDDGGGPQVAVLLPPQYVDGRPDRLHVYRITSDGTDAADGGGPP